MNDIRNEAAAIAAQDCRDTYVDWRITVEQGAPAQFELMKFAYYQINCETYKRITDREFAPVLWQAVQE
jgi:hypothetical protein